MRKKAASFQERIFKQYWLPLIGNPFGSNKRFIVKNFMLGDNFCSGYASYKSFDTIFLLEFLHFKQQIEVF